MGLNYCPIVRQKLKQALTQYRPHFKIELGKLGSWCLSISYLGGGLLSLLKDAQCFPH